MLPEMLAGALVPVKEDSDEAHASASAHLTQAPLPSLHTVDGQEKGRVPTVPWLISHFHTSTPNW